MEISMVDQTCLAIIDDSHHEKRQDLGVLTKEASPHLGMQHELQDDTAVRISATHVHPPLLQTWPAFKHLGSIDVH